MIDVSDEIEIYHDFSRISEILATNIFDINNLKHPLRESAFIELIICLRDLMAKCVKYDKRITFVDNVTKCNDTGEKTKDITDVITHIRDAACHINSFKQVSPPLRIMFSSILNDDDIVFCYGRHRIHFKGHILRAFKEAQTSLLPLVKESPLFRDKI